MTKTAPKDRTASASQRPDTTTGNPFRRVSSRDRWSDVGALVRKESFNAAPFAGIVFGLCLSLPLWAAIILTSQGL